MLPLCDVQKDLGLHPKTPLYINAPKCPSTYCIISSCIWPPIIQPRTLAHFKFDLPFLYLNFQLIYICCILWQSFSLFTTSPLLMTSTNLLIKPPRFPSRYHKQERKKDIRQDIELIKKSTFSTMCLNHNVRWCWAASVL